MTVELDTGFNNRLFDSVKEKLALPIIEVYQQEHKQLIQQYIEGIMRTKGITNDHPIIPLLKEMLNPLSEDKIILYPDTIAIQIVQDELIADQTAMVVMYGYNHQYNCHPGETTLEEIATQQSVLPTDQGSQTFVATGKINGETIVLATIKLAKGDEVEIGRFFNMPEGQTWPNQIASKPLVEMKRMAFHPLLLVLGSDKTNPQLYENVKKYKETLLRLIWNAIGEKTVQEGSMPMYIANTFIQEWITRMGVGSREQTTAELDTSNPEVQQLSARFPNYWEHDPRVYLARTEPLPRGEYEKKAHISTLEQVLTEKEGVSAKKRKQELGLSEPTHLLTEEHYRALLTHEEAMAWLKEFKKDHTEHEFLQLLTKLSNNFQAQLKELWQIIAAREILHDQKALEAFITDRINDPGKMQFMLMKETGELKLFLPQEDYEKVLFSRLNILHPQSERETLGRSTVISFGASTAAAVNKVLCQNGLGHLIISDPDEIGLSNTTRIDSADQSDLGNNKADVNAARCINLNPYMRVTAILQALNPENIDAVMLHGQCVLEMVDHPPTKELVRKIAKKYGKKVVMGTGIGNKPIISVEPAQVDTAIHTVPPILTQEQQAYIGTLPKDLQDSLEKTRWLIHYIGKKNIPLAHLANFILCGLGEMRFWAQDPQTTLVTAALTANTMIDILCEREYKSTYQLDMAAAQHPRALKRKEKDLLNELKLQFPHIFLRSDRSLQGALDRLCTLYGL